MKICNRCQVNKDEEEFYLKIKKQNLRQAICKPCARQRQKEYYENNKEKVLNNNYARREYLMKEVDKIKEGKPCTDCGKIYEVFCMDFDHLYDKKMCISKMIHETFSLKNIKKEIQKTELVCVLCHRARTHQRKERSKIKNETRKKVIERNTEIVNLAKDRPCAICNIQYMPWQMDFDHLDGSNKKMAVACLRAYGYSAEVINNEIEKCQVLCALCHRRKTADQWRRNQ